MLNDLIKLNNNTVCFVSSSSNKTVLNLIIFNLYDNDNYMNIRYFFINLFEDYTIKLYCELRLSLFNNFLVMGFSHCPQETCYENQPDYTHYSSLIFFNYPNSSDIHLDIIDYIYRDNKDIKKDIIINLGENITIENNLFGYVFNGTKIINYSNEIYLIKNGQNITLGDIIESGETIRLKFKSEQFYYKGNYTIEFAYVVTEPDFGTNNNYIEDIDYSYGNNKEKNFFEKHEYIGKTSNFTAILSENLTTQCKEDVCSLCFANTIKECVTCLNDYDFIINNKENSEFKNCHIFPSSSINDNFLPIYIEEKTISAINSSEFIFSEKTIITEKVNETFDFNMTKSNIDEKSKCSYDEIISGKCDSKLTNAQIEYIYKSLKEQISANTSKLIQTENVIFQISSLSEQKRNDNPNVSSIDLGECETILKNNSGLTDDEDLIVFKIDIKNEDLSSTYVQYEIYNPRDMDFIPLNACKDVSINVKVPINLDENTQSIYDSLSQAGYNLFDLDDNFYNDICSTYTSDNGTDLTLADRKNIIYDNNGNISMCQESCIFQYYNLTTKKSECDCAVQTNETIINIDKINFENSNLASEFFDTLNNSNFRVLKCYKLVFSKKGQKNNKGSYMMSVLSLIFLILLFVYIIKENAKINHFVNIILEEKYQSSKTNIDSVIKLNKDINIFNKKKNTELNNMKNINSKTNNNNKSKEKEKKEKNRKKKRYKKNKDFFPPRKNAINKIHKQNDKTNDNLSSFKTPRKPVKTINIINIKNSEKNQRNDNNLIKNADDFFKIYKIKDITDEEMNNLEYELAVIIDKRTYLQYYVSLIKKKQLILFAFYPNKDYNLSAVKISLLILSFSLYFTINGFFFSDSTMNKINEDHGKYNFLFQIPQMLYSTLISAVINLILKMLSLSNKQILTMKQEKSFGNAKIISNSIIKCLKIKLAIFFVISLLLMLFFWYFISCFCSVYKNTQKTLIIDTLISFTLSMIYPFGLNLIPGFFRIPALRAQEKNKKYLYNFSGYVAII